MKKCPYCAEDVQDAAIVCRFCQRDIPPTAAQKKQHVGVDGIVLSEGPNPTRADPAPVASPKQTSTMLVLLCVLVGLGTVIVMMSPTSQPRATADQRPAAVAAPMLPPAADWRVLKEWRGSGMKQTETFQTTSSEWRIKWRSSNEPFPNAGILQIYVHDQRGQMIALAANKQGPGSDESYVRSPPGPHYLQINGANIDWVVTVEGR